MLRCSFCQKSEDEVEKLVAGPDVYICNECVAIAARIMLERPGLFRRLWNRLQRFWPFRLAALHP
jgi:ATP-dependent protease Clp ATPase subunit